MAVRVLLACAVAAALCGCSPYGGGEFACTTDQQCGGNGTCADGFCAFPDMDCDSGLRYGDLSGPQSGQCVGGANMPDGGVDAPDAPPGMSCYGTGLVMACFSSPPTGTETLTGAPLIINTDNDTRCDATTNDVAACVIAAETISVPGTSLVGATGSRPLVLVATQTITVNGTLTVASNRQFTFVGAGADMAGCNAGSNPTATSGGAGGSFGGVGGNGAAVGTAGMAGAALTLAFRGGCSGQAGADNVAPMTPGERGRGGGAMVLIAETSITVTGAVTASGGGGGGGGLMASAGGGGGGSGGLLSFDTPSLMISGSAFANGGGGGEASGAQTQGDSGDDAVMAGTAAAGGGGNSDFGTDGGAGSQGAQKNGASGAANCTGACVTPNAGGGGGGGAGFIKLYRDTTNSGGGTISPTAS